MANVPGQPTTPAGPIEAAVTKDLTPAQPEVWTTGEVYIVTSRYGPEGIYSTPEKARNKVNMLMGLSAYRNADSGLMVRPYVLDSE